MASTTTTAAADAGDWHSQRLNCIAPVKQEADLFAGMQTKHVAFGVEGQRDKTIFTYVCFWPLDAAAMVLDPAFFNGAILTVEINKCAVATGWKARHVDQRPQLRELPDSLERPTFQRWD